jgi:hypothetical protein
MCPTSQHLENTALVKFDQYLKHAETGWVFTLPNLPPTLQSRNFAPKTTS